MSDPAPSTAALSCGTLVRDVEPLFTEHKAISFDPVQMVLLQNLVRPRALQAHVTIAKEDFFRGIVYLDAFTEIIAGRATVLDDMGVIVEELERLDEYLDPDLELLVRYTGLFIRSDLGGARFFRPASVRQIRKRLERSDAAPVPGPAALDLFHLAVGRMVADLCSTEEVRGALSAVRGRNDLRIAVLADAIWASLPDDEVDDEARTALAEGRLLDAALALLQSLVASCERWSMRAYVDRIHARQASR